MGSKSSPFSQLRRPLWPGPVGAGEELKECVSYHGIHDQPNAECPEAALVLCRKLLLPHIQREPAHQESKEERLRS